MVKKITPSGIEIIPSDKDQSVRGFFGFVELIMSQLASSLDSSDSNFHMSIFSDFSQSHHPKHEILVDGQTNSVTQRKVSRMLERVTEMNFDVASGSVKIDLEIEDD